MALFIAGMECPVCHEPIGREDDYRGFPPFVRDRADPLYVFHDATVHVHCVEQHAFARELAHTMNRIELSRSGHASCVVCHGPIGSPGELLTTGYLTSDKSNPLFELNFINFHRSHLQQWPRRAEFSRLVRTLEESPTWEGGRVLPMDD